MVIIPSGKYRDAIALMEEGSYTEAEEAFTALGDFKDSPTKVSECQYSEATQLMETGNYLDAKAAFVTLGDFQDSAAKVEECNTNLEQMAENARAKVTESIAQGNYEAALVSATHAGLEDPDSVLLQGEKDAIKAANVNDVVMYGKYDTGKPCQWQVLEKDDESALLLSNALVWESQYNSDSHMEYYDDWENSNLWETMQGPLNAGNFTKGEIAGVLNRKHVYDSGKTCQDRVFFLTSDDVEKCFPDPKSRIASRNGNPSAWWLSDVRRRRTDEGGYVDFNVVHWDGGNITWWGEGAEIGCRPDMWVSFE